MRKDQVTLGNIASGKVREKVRQYAALVDIAYTDVLIEITGELTAVDGDPLFLREYASVDARKLHTTDKGIHILVDGESVKIQPTMLIIRMYHL